MADMQDFHLYLTPNWSPLYIRARYAFRDAFLNYQSVT